MENQDWPITGVVVVADICKCPAGFTTIDRTYDRAEEADLWRDGYFGRRVTRYMCVERSAPQPGRDVLVDVSIINDRDPIPPGFTVVDYTVDTRERAIKKKVMCVRWMNANLTNSAISELIIMAKGTRRPPNGYTMVGELNNLMLCYKMATIKTQSAVASHNSDPTLNMSEMGNNLPYSMSPGRETAYNQGNGYSPSPVGYTPTLPGQAARRPPPQRSTSVTSMCITALSGVPWQLNPRLQELASLKNIQIPEIRYKTIMDIENQYKYHFDLERAAKANTG